MKGYVITALASLVLASPAGAQLIRTVVGTGTAGYNGDAIAANTAQVNDPFGVGVDSHGNLYIADTVNHRIRVVNNGASPITVANVTIQPGNIATVAGNGSAGFSGDTGPATSAQLNNPFGVAVDSVGNIYIADLYNYRVRKVNTQGIITTVAGTGTGIYGGDNGPAISGSLWPYALAVDSRGNLYISDSANQRIRAVNMGSTPIVVANVTIPAGYIATVAGNGLTGGQGDGGPATGAEFSTPYGVAVDSAGNIYICDTYNRSIRVVNAGTSTITVANISIPPGYIQTVAGQGPYGYQGDGGPATSAQFADPDGVAVDAAGNIYVADLEGERIRFVNNRNGLIITIAGTAGTYGYGGDGQPAVNALLSYPRALAVDSAGNVYIPDQPNERIREVQINTATPAITSTNSTSFVVGVASSFVVSTNYWPLPVLTVSGTLPNGVVFTDNGNGTGMLSGTPAAGTNGTYPLIVTSSNNTFSNVVQNFTLTVLAAGTAPVTSTALFITKDVTTSGNWQGAYGSEGYSLANIAQVVPGYASFSILNQSSFTWFPNTPDPRALQMPGSAVRTAATWYATSSFTFDLNVGATSHQFALYALDWDYRGRVQTVQVQDAGSGFPLGTQVISNFGGGAYLIWNITGHVRIVVTGLSGPNPVIGAVFFGTGNGGPPTVTQQPQNRIISAGQSATFSIVATGGAPLLYQWQSQAPGAGSFTNISGANASSYNTPAAQVSDSGTQVRCVVTNIGGSATSAAATLTVFAAGSPLPFVITKALTTTRNDFSGWVGMTLTVGSNPLTVNAVGRIVAPGNTGSHVVKIVDSTNGADVPGSSVTIATAGGTPGSFVYGVLGTPVTLNPTATYYLLSQETSGGDLWYEYTTTLQTQSVASEAGAAYGNGSVYFKTGSPNQSYGPVDFLYGGTTLGPPIITQQPQNVTVGIGQSATFKVIASGSGLTYQWESKPSGAPSFSQINGATSSVYTTPPTTLANTGTQFRCVVTNAQGPVTTNAAVLTTATDSPFVTSFVLGTLRKDFSGWVGFAVTTGSAPVTVTSVGRMVAPGNTGSHTVKIVDAANGSDVTGGAATVVTSGAPTGAYAYAGLTAAVTLNAHATYYFVSQETSGGDQWYDLNTTLQNTSVAAVAGSVYFANNSYVVVPGTGGKSYVPLDFRYVPGDASTTFVSNVTPGTSRNNFSGWVGGSITTGPSPITVTHLGRYVVFGNAGTHTVALVSSAGFVLTGGSVIINLAGASSGAFTYGSLAAPITLSPNTTYYLVSQEVTSGDTWCDYSNTVVQTSPVGTVNGGVYSVDGSTYSVAAAVNHMYVPLDFKIQ